MTNYYQTEKEIVAVVEGFEQCTTTKDGFTHLSHLTVATYYLCHSTPDETFQKMRSGLLRFLDYHGVNRAKYKDGLTWDWIRRIQLVIEQMDSDCSLVELTNEVLERLGDSRLVIEDYSEDGQVKT